MAQIIHDVDIDHEDLNAIIKHVLKTLTETCTAEEKWKSLLVPIEEPNDRISYYSGLRKSLVDRIVSGKPTISSLDLQSRILILDTVKSIYIQNKLPTYENIFEEAINNEQLITNDKLMSLSLFVEAMETLGYTLKDTMQNGKIVIEDPDVRFERYMYLSKLKKIRANSMIWQQIVYIDERLVNDSRCFEKLWLANPLLKLSPELDECIFYHAVSKNGFITGMFSNQASETDFNKWLTDIVLMQLKSPSVIIMDNNPMHGSLESVCPITKHHTKTDMLRWLTNNNIPCSNKMSKPALYELIKKCNDNHKEYKIDRIVKSQGHEVLRLPRHLYDLSITTNLWDMIVSDDALGKSQTMMHLQNQLLKMMTAIKPTMWVEFEHSIEKKEKEIFTIDMAMEKLCDKYELKLKSLF